MSAIARQYKDPGSFTSVPMLGTTLYTSAYNVYNGQLLWTDVTQDIGFARPFVGSHTVAAGDVFLGVCEENAAITLTTNGAVKVRAVQKGRVAFPVASLTQADIGKVIYATTSTAVTTTSTNNLPIGRLVEISEGLAWVEIDSRVNVVV